VGQAEQGAADGAEGDESVRVTASLAWNDSNWNGPAPAPTGSTLNESPSFWIAVGDATNPPSPASRYGNPVQASLSVNRKVNGSSTSIAVTFRAAPLSPETELRASRPRTERSTSAGRGAGRFHCWALLAPSPGLSRLGRWHVDIHNELDGDRPVRPRLSDPKRLALGGFLTGYSDLTRDAYELGPAPVRRLYDDHDLDLFQARRAEESARALEQRTEHRSRAEASGCVPRCRRWRIGGRVCYKGSFRLRRAGQR
jgi:hypothetical protein